MDVFFFSDVDVFCLSAGGVGLNEDFLFLGRKYPLTGICKNCVRWNFHRYQHSYK